MGTGKLSSVSFRQIVIEMLASLDGDIIKKKKKSID